MSPTSATSTYRRPRCSRGPTCRRHSMPRQSARQLSNFRPCRLLSRRFKLRCNRRGSKAKQSAFLNWPYRRFLQLPQREISTRIDTHLTHHLLEHERMKRRERSVPRLDWQLCPKSLLTSESRKEVRAQDHSSSSAGTNPSSSHVPR
jgi:hypothetical protein